MTLQKTPNQKWTNIF